MTSVVGEDNGSVFTVAEDARGGVMTVSCVSRSTDARVGVITKSCVCGVEGKSSSSMVSSSSTRSLVSMDGSITSCDATATAVVSSPPGGRTSCGRPPASAATRR